MPSDFCDRHYSFVCGCEPLVVQVAQAPAAVWVVVELYTKAVRITPNEAATSQIMGKMSIFVKPEVTHQLAGRIVGVYLDEKTARAAVPLVEGAEYIVERHPVGNPPAPLAAAGPEVDPERHGVCITCRAPSATTYCKRCEQERFALLRERDMGIIAEQVPAGA